MNHCIPVPPFAASRAAVLAIAVLGAVAGVRAQTQGPTSSRTPYLVNTAPAGMLLGITSLITTTDTVARTGGGGTHEFGGIPDGLGAFDNGDGTITVLVDHELGGTSGVVRRHGGLGAYVEALIVDKTTLAVLSGHDLISEVIDGAGVVHDAAHNNAISFNRFCSADLAAPSAWFNPASGLGTTARLFLSGEEGGATGYLCAHVATGPDAGRSYLLPRFNLSTNGSGLTGVGGWENALACPFAQDTTLVIGNNDGGTGIMSNALAVYVGQKQATGSEIEKAGLAGGSLWFVQVSGVAAEIANATTRTTNITNGARFSLSATSSTTFSRPEDGAWNPANPRQYFFVTTDRLDTATATGANPTIGATGAGLQTGMSRLWRLTFDDLTNPLAGGVIDLLINGGVNGTKVQMFDNLTATRDGTLYLNEDPGNSTYIGKIWCFDPASGELVQVTKFDPARWGELAAAGGTPGATAPFTNDKETSGILDVTDLFSTTPGRCEQWLLTTAQDHSTAGATASSVEGGQLLLLHVGPCATSTAYGSGCGPTGLSLATGPGSGAVLGGTVVTAVSGIPAGSSAFVAIGLSATASAFGPLPLALDPFGMNGCTLLHDGALDFAAVCVPGAAGTATHTVALANAPQFLNLHFYLQAWSADATANAAGIVTSNGLELAVGSR